MEQVSFKNGAVAICSYPVILAEDNRIVQCSVLILRLLTLTPLTPSNPH